MRPLDNIYVTFMHNFNLRKPNYFVSQKGLQLDHGGLRAVPDAASREQLWVRAGCS